MSRYRGWAIDQLLLLPPSVGEFVPPDKAQSNFTDPESRIMKNGLTYVQACNAQAAVDSGSQVIVAHNLLRPATAQS